MEQVIPVGAVPDPVLLLCGRPSSVPSAWWTPTLVDDDQDTVDRLVAAAAATLEEHGVRDPESGRLTGPLGAVQAIVADARLLVLLETTRPTQAAAGDAGRERRSVIVAERDAVLDRRCRDGSHELLLAGVQATVALLVELLRPTVDTASTAGTAHPSGGTIAALAGRRTPAEVAAALPEHERIATVRITRQTAGPGPQAHMLTVVDHPEGAVVCWAVPDSGHVEVQPLDADGAVDLAMALLGAEVGEVAA